MTFLPRDPQARLLAWAFVLLAPAAFGALALAFGMDANWDLRNYHYFNGFAAWHGLYDRHLLASQTPFFYNPALDVPLYLLMEHLPARAVGFILGGLHGLNAVLMFLIAHGVLRIDGPRRKVAACAALAAFAALGGGHLGILGTTFHDNIFSLGALLSLLLVLARRERLAAGPLPWAWMVLAGLPVGIAAGIKQPLAVYALGLCLALLLVPGMGWMRRLLNPFFFGIGVLIGIAIGGGPWMVYLWQHYGNPLFPYFNDVFRSPWGQPKSYRDVGFIPHTWCEWVFFPFTFAFTPYKTGETIFRELRIPLAFVLIPLAFAASWWGVRRRGWRLPDVAEPVGARIVVAMAVIAYIVWVRLFAIYRYAIPLEILVALPLVLALAWLPLSRRAWGIASVAMCGALLLAMKPGDWQRVPWADRYVGLTTPVELAEPDRTLVIMGGYAPTSFLVPEFPDGVRFLRPQSNFTHPEYHNNAFNPLIARLIREHEGPVFALFQDGDQWHMSQALGYTDLHMDERDCRRVRGTISDVDVLMCPLLRYPGR